MKQFRKWIKRVLPVLALIMVAGLILSRVYQPEPSLPEPEVRITPFEATDYIGRVAGVCGIVESADYLPGTGGAPAFLNMGRPYPDQPFTVIIWGEDRNRWRFPPEQWFDGRRICVTGEIRSHEGTPQIRVRHPEQIRAE